MDFLRERPVGEAARCDEILTATSDTGSSRSRMSFSSIALSSADGDLGRFARRLDRAHPEHSCSTPEEAEAAARPTAAREAPGRAEIPARRRLKSCLALGRVDISIRVINAS